MAPRILRILETPLYVQDPERSARFYERVLGLRRMRAGDTLVPMDAGGGSVLLLFRQGAAEDGSDSGGGWIPAHDASGRTHFAFAISTDDIHVWRSRIRSAGVEIESEVSWPRGGRSLYFRDPDGNSVELATPGIWPVY